jgi:hypothetical protein
MSIPGPDKYNITQGAFEHRSSIFGKQKRASLADESKNPGPGSYSFRYQSTLPQFSIPKSNTSWIRGSSNPGPGSYDSKVAPANSITIKLEARKPFYDEKKDIPGPGSYSYRSPHENSVGYKYIS